MYAIAFRLQLKEISFYSIHTILSSPSTWHNINLSALFICESGPIIHVQILTFSDSSYWLYSDAHMADLFFHSEAWLITQCDTGINYTN